HRRRPRPSPQGCRHAADARARRRRRRPRLRRLDARGAGVEHRCPGAVPPVRLRPGGRAAPLLREHRGRDRDVVRGGTEPGVRRTARRAEAGAGVRVDVDEATLVLGIETSCDETAAALVMGGNDIVSSVVSSQVEIHADFGGVVPEIASRAHLEQLNPVIARAIVEAGIDDARIDAVACTTGPGLIGALLVGVSAAKALALAWDVPFVGVNHLEAHLYPAVIEDPTLAVP